MTNNWHESEASPNVDVVLDMKFARRMAAGLNTSFLIIHVIFLIMFWAYNVPPMMYFNIFSVAFYLGSYALLKADKISLWLLLTYIEVLAHMACAVFFVGWGCGFQITLVGITFSLFFSEYIWRTAGLKILPSVTLSCVSGLVYLALLLLQTVYPPAYHLPQSVELGLHAMMALVTFALVISCLKLLTLITEHAEQLLSDKASHDKLTGLPNRYYMSDYLTDKLAKSPKESLWLAMLDIDDFKNINDTHGHLCGDEVLKALADMLASFDPNIEACRWGGEEFLLAGSGAEDLDSVRANLDRLRVAVADHTIWHENVRLNITITVGVAVYDPSCSIMEWVNAADEKLYYGKKHGKNQVVI